MSKSILNDPTPENSRDDFWDKIKKMEQESIDKIERMRKDKQNAHYNEGTR